MESKREREENPDSTKSNPILEIRNRKRKENSTSKESDSSRKKRKSEESHKSDADSQNPVEFSSFVAAHYNAIENGGLITRNASKIVHLRNFNNWVKTLLINNALEYLPHESLRNLKVLDLCCGKGGDIIKWLKLNVRHVICADIAENSLQECEERLKFLVEKFNLGYEIQHEIILADCTRVRLRGKYRDPSIQLDVVSCQFSFHYCFESLPQAECMLKNVSECLKPGGVFIGTMPNAYEIVKRMRKAGKNSFKNSVFSLEMCSPEPYSLFGAKYNFYLEGVVNCPEFLVHFPTFERLASRHGLKLIRRRRFDKVYEESKNTALGSALLKKMKALETYPPFENSKLIGSNEDYAFARIFCEGNDYRLRESRGRVGTISKSEWEVITLYETFIFQKQKT